MKYNNTSIKIFVVIVLPLISKLVTATPINTFIDNVSPPMNANSVNYSTDIKITFTQSMNVSTLNSGNIKIFGYYTGLLPSGLSYNPVSKTLTIDPNQNMKIGEQISITLTSGIMTESGMNISPFVYKFRIQAIGGNGLFVPAFELTGVQIANLNTGDINGDGNTDLIAGNKIYINDSHAVFSLLETLNLNGIPILADFDNDNDLDILMEVGNKVFFYRNDGTGHFTQTYNFTGSLISFGDLNGDGFLDVAFFDPANNLDLTVRKNNNGIMEPDTSFQLTQGCLGDYRDRIMIDDFNNDGNMDMVGIHGFILAQSFTFILCRNYEIFKNYNAGSFIQNHFFEFTMDGGFGVIDQRNAKSFDYNNDGYVDILSSSEKFTNNLNGTFAESPTNARFLVSSVIDYTGNGNLDMIVGSQNEQMRQYLSDGQGNFTEQTFSTGTFFSTSITDGDFDKDGDMDIAIFDYYTQKVTVFLNSDIPSPVELSSFTSSVNENNFTLNWTTSTEQNNSGFEMEQSNVKSQKSDDWSKIGFVNGNGSSNIQHEYSFIVRNLMTGKYKFRLKQIDYNGGFKYHNLANEVVIGIPEKMGLLQNYPNPFNPVTKLGFGISAPGNVVLKIYNSLGKEVAELINESKDAGYYEAKFDGSNQPCGMYFYRLIVDGKIVDTKRMALVK